MAEQQKPLTDEKPGIIKFLESDITLYIAIGFAFIGAVAMGIFAFLLEGMSRVHLSVVTFLFAGLFFSLIFFKGLKNTAAVESNRAAQSINTEEKSQSTENTQEKKATEKID